MSPEHQGLSHGWKVKKGNHEVVRTLTFQGMRVSIETDKGQYRYWYDKEGNERGKTLMRYPYGYFNGTKESGHSGDDMALDVYVGPVEDAEEVYVVHQMKRPEFKVEDELKVMVGFESLKQARAAYLMHYDDERFLGSVDTLGVTAFKEKYITPFVSKALAGKDVGVVLSSAAGKSPEQFVNPVGVPSVQGLPTQGTIPVPGVMPGMGMGMMGMMGPPPIDVETYDGVKHLIGRVGTMKDAELLNVVSEIWGPGYEFINATPEHVRCEVLGFLLDQRDLLEPEEPLTSQQPPGSTPSPLGSSSMSTAGQPAMGAPSSGANSTPTASPSAPSMGSMQQAPSSKPEMASTPMDPSVRTPSQPASVGG